MSSRSRVATRFFLCVLLTYGSVASLYAQEENLQERGRPVRRLVVTGHGEVQSKPDKAEIVIGVVTENKTSSVAVKDNSAAARRVYDAIRQQRVAEKDIQTVNYSIQPIIPRLQPEPPGRKPEITGYRVYNQVRVTVRDLARLSDILDAVAGAGANIIEGISFGLQDAAAAQEQALEKAIQDARRKADRIAAASGARIIGIYEIHQGAQFAPGPAMFRAGQADMAPPIATGELTIGMHVTITTEIDRALQAARRNAALRASRR
ncbi:MAG: SIMPL domain-containing protein [Chloroherpetonaceae bacterium]|nr:SIMPL domain-containing protein [Chloroherpetonaceae bacterium]